MFREHILLESYSRFRRKTKYFCKIFFMEGFFLWENKYTCFVSDFLALLEEMSLKKKKDESNGNALPGESF